MVLLWLSFIAGTLHAAAVPVLYAHGLIPRWRIWPSAFWLGAAGLVLYGGANTVTGILVLTGMVVPEGRYNAEAILGHAVIWGPLFLLWGLCLGLWLLWRRRVRTGSSHAQPHLMESA